MDDTSKTLTTTNHSFDDDIADEEAGAGAEEDEDESCDVEAWETLTKSLKEVQSVLDHNRRLIQQVNDNHRSKIPNNLAKNVDLIRDINSNISKVIGLYSNLSSNFSSIVREKCAVVDKEGRNGEL